MVRKMAIIIALSLLAAMSVNAGEKYEALFANCYEVTETDYIKVAATQYKDGYAVAEVQGVVNGDGFYCIGNSIKSIKIKKSAKKGSAKIKTGQLDCLEGSPPKTVTVECNADNLEIIDDSSKTEAAYDRDGNLLIGKYTYKKRSAECTIEADGLIYDDEIEHGFIEVREIKGGSDDDDDDDDDDD